MRGGGGGELGGIGPGDEVFCSMRFLASIDHGGRRRPTATMKPYSVTIQNLRTVAPRYTELLARLVYLTWLLHVGSGFETCLVPLSSAKIYYSTVRSCSPTCACTGELLLVVA